MSSSQHAVYQRFAHETHSGLQEERAEIEQAITLTRSFDCGLVPGLLQAPDYARGVFSRFASLMQFGSGGIPAAVEGRIARQRVLDDESKVFHYILTAAALETRMCAPEHMRAQLEALINALERPNLMIGIIPAEADAILPPMHGFAILDDRVVEMEMLAGKVEVTEPEEIALYQDAFNRFEASAYFGGKARTLLLAAAARYE